MDRVDRAEMAAHGSAERRLGAWREVFGACCLMQAACTLARHTERPPGGAEEGGGGATSVPHEGRDAEARAALRLLDLGLIIGGPASKVMSPYSTSPARPPCAAPGPARHRLSGVLGAVGICLRS